MGMCVGMRLRVRVGLRALSMAMGVSMGAVRGVGGAHLRLHAVGVGLVEVGGSRHFGRGERWQRSDLVGRWGLWYFTSVTRR